MLAWALHTWQRLMDWLQHLTRVLSIQHACPLAEREEKDMHAPFACVSEHAYALYLYIFSSEFEDKWKPCRRPANAPASINCFSKLHLHAVQWLAAVFSRHTHTHTCRQTEEIRDGPRLVYFLCFICKEYSDLKFMSTFPANY